ncbi:hypothetical protein AAG570_000570 [Ranatra chinensis]|uniref:Choline/ethanolamine kinase n=1 Tax=Ranatra chinensis TaxID=642074 RepID=A0ABD0YXF0_9HEMI
MLGDSTEMVETAVRICRGYLNGPWKKITANDVTVKRVSGGLSNWLYQVCLLKGNTKPKQVLLRLYGQTHGEGALESLITESVIFTLLSERRLGPRLHGIFPGGRIEEYIPARPLKSSEMSDPKMNMLVAEKMAAIHTMNVPISKEPQWLWNTIDRNHLAKVNSPVVFCHNDLQEGNILLREDTAEPSLVIIDFEYCSYNYRGFDLANHFIEWIYDYTNPEYPNFSIRRNNYASRPQMVAFVERYLSALSPTGVHGRPEVNNPEYVVNEIENFTLASHFFWGIWSLVNAKVSQIPFGYNVSRGVLNLFISIFQI